MERTLILIKPDGIQRGLVGPILSRFEARWGGALKTLRGEAPGTDYPLAATCTPLETGVNRQMDAENAALLSGRITTVKRVSRSERKELSPTCRAGVSS